jgi:predicted alpha/beta-hydrolase family hydrolase
MTAAVGEHQFQLDSPAGALDAVQLTPDNAVAQLVFAHGAGAGYQHATMQGIAEAFASVGLATLRFNFPYMQQGKRRVDNKAVSVASIVAAATTARKQNELPLFLAGHSFGGRMCSHAVVDAGIECAGLVFCSFPLHPPKKPSVDRAAHMTEIKQLMLFLSGTRDDLAQADLLEGVVANLSAGSRIHWLETANHSYTILKRVRTSGPPVFTEMAQQARDFVDEVI